MFTPGFARHVARTYARKGLDPTARRMVTFLEQRGLHGRTVLEIGGGIGEVQIELLKRGAASTVNLELSPAYDTEAERLLREAGFDGRVVQRRIHDVAADPDGVESADIVVLHRVVCCYPDHERLLSAVADRARHLVVFSYPPRHAASRLMIGAVNLVMRLGRRQYRAFVHPPADLIATLERRGMRPTFAHRGLAWNVAGFER